MLNQEIACFHGILQPDNFKEKVVNNDFFFLFGNYIFGSCFMVNLV